VEYCDYLNWNCLQ